MSGLHEETHNVDVDALQKKYEARLKNKRYRGKDNLNNAFFQSKPGKKKNGNKGQSKSKKASSKTSS